MRRIAILVLTLLTTLGSVVMVGVPASAQGNTRNPADVLENCVPGRPPTEEEEIAVLAGDAVDWEGVCRPTLWDAPAPDQLNEAIATNAFAVGVREDFAALPVRESPEFLVVVVQDGTFALDVEIDTPGEFVLYAAGADIPILDSVPGEPYYVDSGEVLRDAANAPCTVACVLSENMAVQLRPGDRVVSIPGSVCIYCLIGNTETRDGETGVLEIFPIPASGAPLAPFSLLAEFDEYQSRDISADAQASPAMGWAMFHPATRCRGGRG